MTKKAKPHKRVRRSNERQVSVRCNPGWEEVAEKQTVALKAVVMALGDLNFEEKRNVLTWAAETHGIDPGELQGRATRV